MSNIYRNFEVVGGAQSLSGAGYPDVHRFTASSFYNWEEDNLPILDLEARSELFRQHLGLNSDLTGVTLVVSSTAPLEASSQGVYPTVQDALNIVPANLTFPLLIEVCDFGDLGHIEIQNIRCEGAGALQITTRQFATHQQTEALQTTTDDVFGPLTEQDSLETFHSTDIFPQIESASSTKLGVNCSDVDGWKKYSIAYYQSTNSQQEAQVLGFAVANENLPPLVDTVFGPAVFATYTSSFDNTVSGDPFPKTQGGTGTSLISARRGVHPGDFVNLIAYASFFRSIKISNCRKIKLQNVCIDSGYGSDLTPQTPLRHLCDRGLSIQDSNVVLENVAVSRFNKTGVFALDSTLNISKSFIINRIYTRNENKTRPENGVGLYLVDSVAVFDPTPVTQVSANSGQYVDSISKCGIGIHCINSTILGGAKNSIASNTFPKNGGYLQGAAYEDVETTKLYIGNNFTGAKLENSVVDYDGRLEVFCNIDGVKAYESTIVTPQFSIDYNQGDGIGLFKSSFKYGKYYDYFAPSGGVGASPGASTGKTAYTCDYNGTNARVSKGSTLTYVDCSAVPELDLWGGSTRNVYGDQTLTGRRATVSHGVTDVISKTRTPSISVTDGSYAELVHFSHIAPSQKGNVAGIAGVAAKNSNLIFRGSGKSQTVIGGYNSLDSVESLEKNWTTAALASLNNSDVTLTGPTKISKFGICILAEGNSRATLSPPTLEGYGWVPDSTKFQLSSTSNHSKFDLHSTRACLVANNKSTISMVGLGGSALNENHSVDTVALSGSDLFDLYTSSTSGSYVSMYPNGFTRNSAGSPQVECANAEQFGRTNDFQTFVSQSQLTTGGMCVRAVGSSKIDVNLVNFKCSLDSVDVSGAVYNYFGTGCEYDGTMEGGVCPSPFSDLCSSIIELSCCPTTTTLEVITTTTATSTNSTSSTTTVTDSYTSSTSTSTTSTSTTTTSTTSTTTTTTSYTSSTTTSTTTTSTSTTTTSTTSYSTSTSTGQTTTSPMPHYPDNQDPPPTVDIESEGLYKHDRGGGKCDTYYDVNGNIEFSCVGSKVHMWNIADSSRLHCANITVNNLDPSAAAINNAWHGPTGRWENGAACDYYGKLGLAARALDACGLQSEGTADGFYNLGFFRILGSHKGYLKMYGEVDYGGFPIASQYFGGGSPLDQLGTQGYQSMFDCAVNFSGAEDPTRHVGLEGGASPGTEPVFGRGLAGGPMEAGKINGMVTHAPMVEGYGMVWDMGQLHPQFPVPPLNLDWNGYIRNWLDQTAVSLFANARHGANKKVNLLSIYRANTLGLSGGEGRDSYSSDYPTYGVGVKSLNLFSLDRIL